MSVDQLIAAYVEIKGETPPDGIGPRDADFYKAVKPAPARIAGVKRRLEDAGFTLVDTASGNYTCWDNRIVIKGSKQRLDEVFGLEVQENNDPAPDAPTHHSQQPMHIRHDAFLAENVSSVIFPTYEEVKPVASRRRVRQPLIGSF